MNDLPLIRIKPAPSDAELEADRDRKHARDVEEWFTKICRCGHWRSDHQTACVQPVCDRYNGEPRLCPCREYRP